MRIAVIGGLASGPAAAAEAARANPNVEVVLYEQSPYISVGSCEIPYFVADQIPDASSLEVLTPQEFERTRGAKVFTQHRVESIDPDKGTLEVQSLVHQSRHQEQFDRFILATGARARKLDIDGEDADGVFAVRGLQDAVRIKNWLETQPVHHVVVIGGGFIGLEMAEAIHQRGLRATILDPSGRVLRNVLPDSLVNPMMLSLRESGVAVRAERATKIGVGRDGEVVSVRTDKGEIIGCQSVIVGVGIEPRTELAASARIKIGQSGGIAVDDQMRTSRRNVWACGDGIEVPRIVDGKKVLWPLSPIARRTARVAARNAVGIKPADRFTSVTPSVAVKAFGVEAASVGLSIEQAIASGFDADTIQINHWSRVSSMPRAKRLLVNYVFERRKGRLLGGSLVGEEGAALRANVLVPWIRTETTVKQIAEEMDLVYTPPLAPSMDPLRVAASVAMRTLKKPRTRS